MPGINFIFSFNTNLESLKSQIAQAQNSMKHSEDYYENVLFAEGKYFLGYVKYKDYPIETIESNNYFIFIKDKIYNKNFKTLKSELFEIAKVISFDNEHIIDNLRQWILDSDFYPAA